MITFVIKSTMCLIILYGFYHLFLCKIKVFNFNRYYLLVSLLFALIVPFIIIPLTLNLPFSINLFSVSAPSAFPKNSNDLIDDKINLFTFKNILVTIYFVVSFILLLRFVLNIYKITRKIRKNIKIYNLKTQIVLINDETLPYSFFRYIFVNRENFQNGKIENELIIHEQTHCLQNHSIDILIIEFVNIVLWFNPFIWLFRKAIQLNHEFLADDKVLSTHELNGYQNTLLNIVFRNNSTYLASNFNYSLTKKRLIMMQKSCSKSKKIRIVFTIPLFLFLGLVIANAQVSSKTTNGQVKQNDTIPPPPPPPVKEKQVKKDKASTATSKVQDKQVKKEDAPPPPPPPPPIKKD